MTIEIENKDLANIPRNENVLRIIRDTLRGTELFAHSKFDLGAGGFASSPETIHLSDEKVYDWQYAYRAQRPVPNYVRWHTSNRMAFVHNLGKMLNALAGTPIQVTLDISWSWKRGAESCRPQNKTQYVPEYSLFIAFTDGVVFDPNASIASILNRTCASSDPRADRSLFEVIEDSEHSVGANSYRWTPYGAQFHVDVKRKAEALAKVFSDCQITIARTDDKKGWVADLVFPDMLNTRLAA